MNALGLSEIIQGGMGVGVSGWALARAVSSSGQLGVVSGTALDVVMARRLQAGDPDGAVRRGLEQFPSVGVAERIIDRFFVEGGIGPGRRYRPVPMAEAEPAGLSRDLMVAANFVEVLLAKEGHGNPVGINYLAKIQAPFLPSLYGAMLAGVDVVLVGAGIPREVPKVLDAYAEGRCASMRMDLEGSREPMMVEFNPASYLGMAVRLARPKFLAIVSSHVLAAMLATRIDPPADGFVVEYSGAGGHNAPPRAKRRDGKEVVFGPKDVPDLEVIRELGLPFWLAGGQASPESLEAAKAAGASGVQIGTAFAYCEESGLDPDLKRAVLEASAEGQVSVTTDGLASPTGFPFKVVDAPGLPDPEAHGRRRVCDLGFLRTAYVDDKGEQGWRCPSEPVEAYVQKGGNEDDTEGRRCLCNALMANVGLGQRRGNGTVEVPILTSGDDVATVARFLPEGAHSYTAQHVIDTITR